MIDPQYVHTVWFRVGGNKCTTSLRLASRITIIYPSDPLWTTGFWSSFSKGIRWLGIGWFLLFLPFWGQELRSVLTDPYSERSFCIGRPRDWTGRQQLCLEPGSWIPGDHTEECTQEAGGSGTAAPSQATAVVAEKHLTFICILSYCRLFKLAFNDMCKLVKVSKTNVLKCLTL